GSRPRRRCCCTTRSWWTSCASPARASSPRPSASACASSGTCTTVPSSGCWRSRCGWPRRPRRAGPRGPEGSRRSRARPPRAAAAGELVDLAHGLYPALLRERGLADGLRARAREAALPVQVIDRGVGRLPGPVEEAVYYCVSEAVQNAAKHGGPETSVSVTLE